MSKIRLNPFQIERYYFPVNLSLFEDLVGKMLTHIEAVNLPPGVEKANKDLIRQSLWRWWEFVQENSLSSYKNCIGPIMAPPKGAEPSTSDGYIEYVWLTEGGRIAFKGELDQTPAQSTKSK